ncbi:MAG: TonB family protein [Bacteroidota bacterium]
MNHLRKILFIFILSFIANVAYSQETDPNEFVQPEVNPVIDLADIQRKIVYPEIAKRLEMEGKVVVQVLLGKDGLPMKYIIRESAAAILDTAAAHAVMMATSYKPAYEKGKPISVWVAIPVTFRLRNPNSNFSDEENLFRNWTVLINAVKDTPSEAAFTYYRGMEYFKKAKYELAESDFHRTQELGQSYDNFETVLLKNTDTTANPLDAKSLKKRAQRYQENSLYSYALRDYTTILALQPNDLETYTARAGVFKKLGNINSSIAELQKLLTLKPNDTSMYVNIGWYYYEQEMFDSSLAYSKKAVEHDAENLTALYNIALVHLRLGNYDVAEGQYTDTYKLDQRKKANASWGAIQDLKNLVRLNVRQDEARKILSKVFKRS